MTDARTAATRDAAEIAGLTIHQKYLAARPVLIAAMDAAISHLRYPDDVTSSEAGEFLDYVFDKPAACQDFGYEAMSEMPIADVLTLVRYAQAGNTAEAGKLICRAIEDYAASVLEARLVETGYEKDEVEADHAYDLWRDSQLETRS
jgi:hypothetical protein